MHKDTVFHLTAALMIESRLSDWTLAFDEQAAGVFSVRRKRKLLTLSPLIVDMSDEAIRSIVMQAVESAKVAAESDSQGEYVALCRKCGNRYYRNTPHGSTFCYACGKHEGKLVFT